MAALRGYTPLGGTSRRYRAPGGKIISRREYDNRRARKAGFKNRYELEKYRESLQASKWSRWTYNVYKHTGSRPTWEDYAAVREVRQRRAKLRKLYPNLSGGNLDAMDSELVAPGGPLERVLAAAGLRTPNGRPVGDS